MESFQLTHFYRRSPDRELWIQTSFICRGEGSTYYIGFSGRSVSPQEIQLELNKASLIALKAPCFISKSQTVWISPNQEVYIAELKDPFSKNRQLIYKDEILGVYHYLDEIVASKLGVDFDDEDNVIGTYCLSTDWPVLLSVIVDQIRSNDIDEEDFEKIGYIFLEMEKHHGRHFHQLMKRKGFWILENTLMFSTENGPKKWEISISEKKYARHLEAI